MTYGHMAAPVALCLQRGIFGKFFNYPDLVGLQEVGKNALKGWWPTSCVGGLLCQRCASQEWVELPNKWHPLAQCGVTMDCWSFMDRMGTQTP